MDSYLPEKQIIVTGYPRSGNSWMARLLGDILNCPVEGWKDARPIAREGADRPGDYVVRQLHLKPTLEDADEFLPTAWHAHLGAWSGEKVIHVFRDPRDVAVSVMHYWERPSIEDSVQAMINGKHPLVAHGPWLDYVKNWINQSKIPVSHITYEMLSDTMMNIEWLLDCADIPFSRNRLNQAIERQSFKVKRQHIAENPSDYAYGKKIQMKAMRKGVVGDWKNHFTPAAIEMAKEAWGNFMNQWGYWW